jgi:hypothetical protein
MLLRSSEAPTRGTYLEICRGAHLIIGRVVWSKPDRFGVQTQDRVPVECLTRTPDQSPSPVAVESTVAVERRSNVRSFQETHERSRIIGRIVEFGTFLIVAGLATLLVGGVAVEILFEPLAQADAALASR